MKNKISVGLLALGLVCGSAYAAHTDETPMPVSNDIQVTAPQQSGTWSFGATAVLMQPTNQAFTYADVESNGEASDSGGFTAPDNFQDVNQGYHWWFGVDVTYAFPGNGRDVTLAYEGLRGSDTDNTVPSPNTTLYPLNYSTYYKQFVEFNTATGESKTSYDAGDLVFGQNLDVGQRIRLHPFAGLRYAYINVKNTASYVGSYYVAPGNLIIQDIWESTFRGIGPRLGSDAQISLGKGFSVRARLGLSALIGSSKPKMDDIYLDTSSGYPADTFPINHESSTQVVPEIDGRLGLNYTHNINSKLALGVEAGWQATEYIDGVTMIPRSTNQATVYQALNDPTDSMVNRSNFGVQGPYARLQLDIS